MGKYRAYSEYKDSGVEWLGEVPEHWSQKRVRFFLENGNNGMKIGPFGSALKLEDMVDDGIKVYGQENIINNNYSLGKRRISPEKHAEMRVYDIKRGDLLVTMMGTSGRCQVVPPDAEVGIIDSHLLRLRPNPVMISSELLRWIVDESPEVAHQVRLQGKGSIMNGLNSSIIKNLLLTLPAVDEQTQIATFLDRETAKIDRLIAKQEALIELLKEKRQAVISHAVTKGLDPDAPMKDSGVEWLGEIPAHWEVKRAKHLLEFVTSGSRGWAQYYADEGDLFFRIGNLTRDGIYPDLSDVQKVSAPSGSEGERSRIRKDDLLISITADLGSTAVATEDVVGGYVSQHVALARPSRAVHSAKWFAFTLISDAVKNQFWSGGYGGTKIQLSLEDVRELHIPVPDELEQARLVEFIESKLKQMDKLIKKAIGAIELLQERRTALISAAVTGKIDVREEM